MFCWELGTSIIIFGAGNMGKRTYYKYRNLFKVMFFLDNKVTPMENDYLYELNVFNPKELKSKNNHYKIVITSEHWEEMAHQLTTLGLVIYDDFVPHWLFDYESIDYVNIFNTFPRLKFEPILTKLTKSKKIAIIHGNCQTNIITEYLKANNDFSSNYIFYNIPRICVFYNKELLMDSILWKNCSLFISQNISTNNRFGEYFSTKNLTKNLPNECKTVIIPNLWFSGYFPQHKSNTNNIMLDVHQGGLFPYSDLFIENLIKEKNTTEEIIFKISNNNFFTKEFIDTHISNEFIDIEKRENQCDIHMVDFIKIQYKEKLLFYSCSHPTNYILKELAKRLLKYLNFNNLNFNNEQYLDEKFTLKGQDELLYPSIINHLGLDNSLLNTYYYSNRYLVDEAMSFEDFIKTFISSCFTT